LFLEPFQCCSHISQELQNLTSITSILIILFNKFALNYKIYESDESCQSQDRKTAKEIYGFSKIVIIPILYFLTNYNT
ncbi:unnamed protein product, partial [marine sediment metagenome]